MFRVRAITLALTLFGWPASALAAAPPALVSVLGDFVRAASGNDAKAFTALFAPEPSITDTLKPYHWQGKGAASAYFDALQDTLSALGWSGLRLQNNGDPFVAVGQGVAYAAIPLVVAYIVRGTAHADKGTFTLSLKQAGTGWLIESATWTYTTPPS